MARISKTGSAADRGEESTASSSDCATELDDDGTNDLVISDVLRTNELQVWFLSEQRVRV